VRRLALLAPVLVAVAAVAAVGLLEVGRATGHVDRRVVAMRTAVAVALVVVAAGASGTGRHGKGTYG
jgi:hypothetical protein